ncbi:hypothetical protein AB0N05_14480 [Nocardia sp. NPDC051030]|uniref:hypothetical protein n=1 Tax=Nocardia sp. NPDC051030 TaxID=3155162 RepID=UPI0034312346
MSTNPIGFHSTMVGESAVLTKPARRERSMWGHSRFDVQVAQLRRAALAALDTPGRTDL